MHPSSSPCLEYLPVHSDLVRHVASDYLALAGRASDVGRLSPKDLHTGDYQFMYFFLDTGERPSAPPGAPVGEIRRRPFKFSEVRKVVHPNLPMIIEEVREKVGDNVTFELVQQFQIIGDGCRRTSLEPSREMSFFGEPAFYAKRPGGMGISQMCLEAGMRLTKPLEQVQISSGPIIGCDSAGITIPHFSPVDFLVNEGRMAPVTSGAFVQICREFHEMIDCLLNGPSRSAK